MVCIFSLARLTFRFGILRREGISVLFVDKRRNWEQFPFGNLNFLMMREDRTRRTLKQHIQRVLLRSHARNGGRGEKKVVN
jgi:hypothetical protein